MASHLLPLTLSVTVVIDVRHAYIITLPALFINPSDYLTVTKISQSDKIRTAKNGKRTLICLDDVLDYLEGGVDRD